MASADDIAGLPEAFIIVDETMCFATKARRTHRN